MKTAFIFPGQGSQQVGMCKELYEHSSVAKEVFQEVDEALQQKLSNIIFEGPTEELTLTENTQPALMACSMALLKALEKEIGNTLPNFCDYVAGHSLGEFTALTAANAISITDCAKILKIRGQAMQCAVPIGNGAMFALLGANIEVAETIAKEASTVGICQVANDNSYEQQVLSGSVEGIDKAIELATAKGYKAIKLNVSAPFHSAMMEPAQHKLKLALERIKISAPKIRLIANISADVLESNNIIDNLVQQVTSKVRWTESIIKLKNLGVSTFVEIGPGKVYTNLLRRIDKSLTGVTINDQETIATFLESNRVTN